MQKALLLIPFMLQQLLLNAQDKPNLTIQHLTDNFYIYTTYKNLNGYRFPSNSMYLVTEKGAVLIDTPWDTTQIQPLLESIWIKHQAKVVLTISTHYHDDRTAGLEYLSQKGIKTYTSRFTNDLSKQHNERQAEYYFEKDTIFQIDNYKFETYYPGEGHTKDNIVIWFNDYEILYGGCLIKSTEYKNLGNIRDANITEWPISLKRIIEKYSSPRFVIPGHFGWKGNGVLHTLNLLEVNK